MAGKLQDAMVDHVRSALSEHIGRPVARQSLDAIRFKVVQQQGVDPEKVEVEVDALDPTKVNVRLLVDQRSWPGFRSEPLRALAARLQMKGLHLVSNSAGKKLLCPACGERASEHPTGLDGGWQASRVVGDDGSWGDHSALRGYWYVRAPCWVKPFRPDCPGWEGLHWYEGSVPVAPRRGMIADGYPNLEDGP